MDAQSSQSDCTSDVGVERITVRFDEDLLNRIDNCIENDDIKFHNRSQLIRTAIKQLLSDGAVES